MHSNQIITLFALLFVGISTAQFTEYGICKLTGTSAAPGISGWVYFVSDGVNQVQVWANIAGITPTSQLHGMHVHQYGDLTPGATPGVSAGTHFAGVGTGIHGCPPNGTRDEGDMGNWDVSADGNLVQNKTLDLLTLTGGNSIIGRAVILHNATDNCETVASSGARLAQCVIGLANKYSLPASVGTVDSATNGAISAATVTRAVCNLVGFGANTLSGSVIFDQGADNKVTITAHVTGLAFNTSHGIHLHEFGDLTNSTDGTSLGAHYNPYNLAHGLPSTETRHYGDLGNICTYSPDGTAYYNSVNDIVKVSDTTAAYNVIGRGVVIHSIRDDGSTNYGARIAGCVVGVASTTTTPVDFTGVTISDAICENPLLLANNIGGGTTTGSATTASATTATASGSATTGSLPVSTTGKTSAASGLTQSAKLAIGIVIPLVFVVLAVIA